MPKLSFSQPEKAVLQTKTEILHTLEDVGKSHKLVYNPRLYRYNPHQLYYK